MAYTENEKEEVLSRVFNSIEKDLLPLREILRRSDMPSTERFYSWINDSEELSKRYARACEARADAIFEQILEIADDNSKDVTEIDMDGVIVQKVDYEHIQRSKLRVDARKWMLGKMQPKKYGDKSEFTLNGGDKPLQISFED